MRPLRLIIKRFGPYAGAEDLDFRNAIEAGLFGVYGATGSGKSSIFSAITFALFGESAKADEKPDMLRSHHAASNHPTEVTFVFELGSKIYHIRRHPPQERPKARGDGLMQEGPKAYFFDATGIPIDDISDDNPGSVLVEKNVSKVNIEINTLLGYNADQFRQIVLLPQGKFETFLKANTKERVATLKELFDVSIYQKITDILLQDAKDADEHIKHKLAERGVRLRDGGFESPDALDDGIASVNGEIKTLSDTLKEQEQARATAEAAHKIASETETKFIVLAEATKACSDLVSKEAAFKVDGEKLSKARQVAALQDIERTIANLLSKCTDAEKKLTAANNAVDKAKTTKTACTKNKAAADQKTLALNDLRPQKTQLEGWLPALQAADGIRDKLTALKMERTTEEKNMTSLKAKRTACENAIQNQETKIATANESSRHRAAHQESLNAARSDLKLAVQYEEAAKQFKKSQENEKAAEEAKAARESLFETSKKDLADTEAALSESQAYHLAQKLQEGEPCPVCGSEDHPLPATTMIEAEGRDQNFRAAKANMEHARETFQTCSTTHEVQKEMLNSQRQTLETLETPKTAAHLLRATIEKIENDITALGPPADFDALQRKLSTLKRSQQKHNQALETAKETLVKIGTSITSQQTGLTTSLSDLPAEIQTPMVCEEKINQLRSTIQSIENNQNKVDRALNLADTALATNKTDYEAAKATLESALSDHTNETLVLQKRLETMGFTNETYLTARMPDEDMEALAASIKTFEGSLAAARDRLKRAKTDVQKLDRPELQTLRTALAARTVESDATKEILIRTNAKSEQLTHLKKSLEEADKAMDVFEEETRALRALSSSFNGTNQMNMKLETYALSVMFERILEAANRRIKPMTGSRYHFEHSSEGLKGGGSKGLDIMIHDINTGRSRSPATLSGGETFMAALSLALGLSEVVEGMGGNIRLDTIFIDEGFGSLDSDDDGSTLNAVLKTLADLAGHNRAVGLISHVPRVQEAIPNGFKVETLGRGSTVETMLL